MKQLLRILTVGLTSALCAASVMALETLHDAELRQQQIRLTTQQVGEQISQLVADLEQNNLTGGQELKTFESIQSALAHLTEKEMEEVISLLQSARAETSPSTTHKNSVTAYTAQKQIVAQLRYLFVIHQQQQTLQELARLFQNLATRQDTNYRETIVCARLTDGKAVSQFNDAQHTALDLQQVEQKALQQETIPLLSTLTKLAMESADERPKIAARQVKDASLESTLNLALTNLAEGNLPAAAANQKIIRDQFRTLARLLTLPHDDVSRLRQAIRDLDALMREEHDLHDQTSRLPEQNPDTAPLVERQSDNTDHAQLLQQDLKTIAPLASDRLQRAASKMQDAGTALASKEPERAIPNQQAAINALEQTRQLLDQQLTKAERDPQKQIDPITRLKDADRKLADLRRAQEQLNAESTTAPTQKTREEQAAHQRILQQQTQDIRQQTATISPAATDSLGTASEQMGKAADMLPQKPSTAHEAQQAVLADLNRANDAIKTDLARLDQASANLRAIQAAQEAIAPLIRQQQQLRQATANAVAQSPATPPSPNAAASQQQLAANTASLANYLPAAAQPAAQPLAAARQEMNAAANSLQQGVTQAALPQQSQALDNLQKAQAALEQSRQEIASQLGQPSVNPDAAAQALAQLQQAQQQTARAQEQLAHGSAPAAGQSLQSATGTLGAITTNPTGLPSSATQSLQQAQQALADATAQAVANHSVAASVSAAQALTSMAQAEISLNAAAAVTTSAPGSTPGQGTSQTASSSQQPGSATSSRGTGQGNQNPTGSDGNRTEVKNGEGQFIGLPPRERAAIQQSQSEKYPQEYGPLIEQYMKNLADHAPGGDH